MIVKIWVQKSKRPKDPSPKFLTDIVMGPKTIGAKTLPTHDPKETLGEVVDTYEDNEYMVYTVEIYPEKMKEVRKILGG